MDEEILFSEVQRFRQPWLWMILLATNGLMLYFLLRQVNFGQPVGSSPMPGYELAAGLLLTLLITLLFYVLRLETRIGQKGVYVRLFPLHKNSKFYSWGTITQSYVRKYNPIGEYGGWGLRGFGKNRAFNVSGNKGIQLVTQNGSRVLIGTNKVEEVERILKQTGHFTPS